LLLAAHVTISSQLRLTLVTCLVASCAGSGAGIDVEPGAVDDTGGKADGSDPRVELKLTIDPGSIARARSKLGLKTSRSQARKIWFYDTPNLDAFEAGLILRARKIDGAPDDSTVKLRPFTADDLDAETRGLPGLKCEHDRSATHDTPSCSLTAEQARGEIDAVGDGDRRIDQLFSSDQEDLIAGYGPGLGWAELGALGPIPAKVWTLRTDELPSQATAELWDLPDASELLELSIKVGLDDGDAAMAELEDFIAARGLALDPAQETKTRRALELLRDAP